MEKCLKPIFPLKLLAMKLESSLRHLASNKDIKIGICMQNADFADS